MMGGSLIPPALNTYLIFQAFQQLEFDLFLVHGSKFLGSNSNGYGFKLSIENLLLLNGRYFAAQLPSSFMID